MARDRPTRRRLLTTLAAAVGAGVAGCSTPESTSPDTRSPTRTADRGDDRGNRFSRVYRDVVDSVVLVRTYTPAGDGQGSGFLFDGDHVITNHHVLARATDVEIKFNEGEWRSAEVVGTDAYSDLAVLSVSDSPEHATPLDFTGGEVFVGQEVLALGHPFGLASSISSGIVSGVDRVLAAPNDFLIPATIQTTAAVNPGNSGGPLVSMEGDVAGVVTAGGGENIGFAVGVRLARRVVPVLVEDGEYRHSYAGVRLQEVTPTVAEANDLPEPTGVLVVDVKDDGPADGVLEGSDSSTVSRGRRIPVGGDVVLSLDDREIKSLGALSTYLALETSPGDEIEVTVLRAGERRTVSFTLGTRPPPT